MSLGELWRRLWYLLNRSRIERALEEEMAAHREMMGDPRRFGNPLKLREESRDAWGWGWLDRGWQDLRYGTRVLRKAPAFTITAIVILSAGIGLNLTLFHLLDVAVLRPPAVKDPHTLVRFNRMSPSFESTGIPYPATQFIRHHNAALSAVLTRHRTEIAWEQNTAERLEAAFVSANWFSELGHRASLGRVFAEAIDERADTPPITVISHELWQNGFGGANDVVGQIVRINDLPATVIGVAPADFPGFELEHPRLWLLINQFDHFNTGTAFKEAWADHNTELYGRLRSGVSAAAAQSALTSTMQELARIRPNEFKPDERLKPLSAVERFLSPRERREMMLVTSLAGGLMLLVLMVASANLGNLVLSRAIGRVREFSVRAALGANHWRIFRHLLVESAALTVLGAGGGIALAVASARLFAEQTRMPPYLDFTPDWRLFGAAFAFAFIAMTAFGVVPALTVSRRDLIRAMKDGGQQTSAGLARARIRRVFLGAQMAGCCALLVVAGATGRGLQRLLIADPGFRFEHVAVLDAELTRHGIDGERARAFWSDLKPRIAAHPNVGRLALVYPPPLAGIIMVTGYNDVPSLKVSSMHVEPDFFALMDIPIVKGRTFRAGDGLYSATIISRRLALAMYGTLDVVGEGFPKDRPERRIVGIAGDAPMIRLRARDGAEHYLPLDPDRHEDLVLIAGARANPETLLPALRSAARSADPRILPATFLLRDEYEEHLQGPRFASLIAGAVGLLVLALSCLGIFGVVAYAVTLRSKEMGIRRALGAEDRQIVLPLLRQLVWPVALGIPIGISLGLTAAHFLEGEPLYLASADAIAPIGAVIVFGLTSMIAALVPASRALNADPVRALRHE